MVDISAQAALETPVITCDLWFDPQRLFDEFEQLDSETARDLTAEASWTLDMMLGDRYHNAACWDEWFELRNDSTIVHLGHGPVTEIIDVQIVDACNPSASGTSIAWCNLGARRVRVGGGTPTIVEDGLIANGWFGGQWLSPVVWSQICANPGRQVKVSFRAQSSLPPGAGRVALIYARELAKQLLGQSCALPERIQTIQRQGVTWTILDPGTHLDKALTGLGSVDTWLVTARRAAGGVAIDPRYPTHIRCEKYCCEPSS